MDKSRSDSHACAVDDNSRTPQVSSQSRSGCAHVSAGLLEHVADAGGADADEHLHKLRAGRREERHPRLAGDGLRQQRLASA